METIEQLKQDNAKLTERLNNAAKFFREQKAQIETLTKENEELKVKSENFENVAANKQKVIEKLEEELNNTPKEEVISTEDWNKLATEKENLNEQLKDKDVEITNQKDALQSCYNQLHDYEMMIDSLNKEKEDLNTLLNEYRLKLQKLESDIDSKDKAYKVLQGTYNEVFAENKQLKEQVESWKFGAESDANNLENLNKQLNEYELKFRNANAAYEELRKKYTELKELHDGDLKRYNELEDNYEGLQNKYKENDIAKREAELKAENLQAEYVKKFEEQDDIIKSLKKENKETEEQFNKILNSYEKEISDLKSKNANIEQQLQEQTNSIKTLQDKFDKLNQAYNNCENEKLSWEADYHKLDEQYKSLTIQASANKEVAAKYEEIFEDYEKYKEFVNALFTKAKEVNIVWASPEELKDKDKQNTNKETKQPQKNQNVRMINQEMNVQGGISINM